jgi:ribosomal protein L23
MINYEIKSQLAKLLATEDIIVENKNVETACFDVERRVLTLPMWKRASNIVYDMLVGHEVGHALYTPNEDWHSKVDIPMSFVNVVEDVRIEKLMKRKYAGIAKSFYGGYRELSEKDFFCLEGEDISKMSLADRVNLHYKIGHWVQIPFSQKEMPLVIDIGHTETFADVLIAAEELYKFCKEELKDTEEEIESANSNSQDGQSSTSPSASGDSESESDNESETQISNASSQKKETDEQEPEVTTDQMFEENVKNLNGNMEGFENRYCQVPDVDIDYHVISNSEVHKTIGQSWSEQLTPLFYERPTGEKVEYRADFSAADRAYAEFKNGSSKEVNYLVKEFEMKKSADAYARAAESKTGTLDCAKLHTYKYNEDLFKKVTVIPDGKSHGLIFILDWSGSMGECLLDTVKQLYNLIWFCRKVSIPFDVYAFTHCYPKEEKELNKSENDLIVDKDFSLMHFFTSKTSKKDVDTQLLNIWRIAYAFTNFISYHIPNQLQLSGTPLNESLICLYKLIPAFKKQHNLQKVQCVILTDGEAAPLSSYRYYRSYYNGDDVLGARGLGANSYLRNRKTGNVTYLAPEYWKFTEALLNDLKATFPDTNFIGIRLLASRDFSYFIRKYEFLSDDALKKYRKEKSYFIKNSGYDSYLAVMINSLSNKTEFEVDDNATKSKIKSAFAKSLKAKSLNKKVLSHFVDLVS